MLAKSGSEFRLQKIDWAWPGYLARGKFHVIAGLKGAGKSTVCFDLMARVTTVGGLWPDGSSAPLGEVVIWSGEDASEDTILPRFAAAGGDLGRIYPIKTVIEDGKSRAFDPSTDIAALVEMAATLPELQLVVIDPVVLSVPRGVDSHKNAETRRGLQPLVDFAEERGVVLIGITHFTKGTEQRDPIELITGSLAFGALPRVALGASVNDDGFQRRLVRIAPNIGPGGGGFEYTLYEKLLPTPHNFCAQCVMWGNKLSGSARELLGGQKRSAEANAVDFLRNFLKGGLCQPVGEIEKAAEADGHKWGTVIRAKEGLHIKPRKIGKAWHWGLPTAAETISQALN